MSTGWRDYRKPVCKNGHSGQEIIRLNGAWVCTECLVVTNSKTNEEMKIRELFPNRAARRRAKVA